MKSDAARWRGSPGLRPKFEKAPFLTPWYFRPLKAFMPVASRSPSGDVDGRDCQVALFSLCDDAFIPTKILHLTGWILEKFCKSVFLSYIQ
jgi:hypothetical protein